jgi:hypothetical protein
MDINELKTLLKEFYINLRNQNGELYSPLNQTSTGFYSVAAHEIYNMISWTTRLYFANTRDHMHCSPYNVFFLLSLIMAESAEGRSASNSAAENRFSDATEEDVFNILTNIN